MTSRESNTASTSQASVTADGAGYLSILLRKAASLLAGHLGGNILTLIYTLVLARICTPAEFGLVMSGFAWAMIMSIALTLNLESGAIRFLVGYRAHQQDALAAGFVVYSQRVVGIISSLLLTALAAAVFVGLIETSEQESVIFTIAAICAPVVAFTRVYGRQATALGHILRGGLPVMLVRPAVLCVLLVSVWLAGLRPDPVAIMVMILVSFVFAAGVQIAVLRRIFSFAKHPPKLDFTPARQWHETGAMMAPLLVLRDNLKHAIVTAAALVLDQTEVGLVALALSLMSLIYFSVKAVDISLSPQLARSLQAGQKARSTHLIGVAAKLKIPALLLGVVGVAILGDWGLRLFGPAYSQAYVPLIILMLFPAADVWLGPAQVVLNVTGHQRYVFVIAGLSTAFLVAGVVIGGWIAGPSGACMGAALSYIVQQMMLRRICARDVGIETSIFALWRHTDTVLTAHPEIAVKANR